MGTIEGLVFNSLITKLRILLDPSQNDKNEEKSSYPNTNIGMDYYNYYESDSSCKPSDDAQDDENPKSKKDPSDQVQKGSTDGDKYDVKLIFEEKSTPNLKEELNSEMLTLRRHLKNDEVNKEESKHPTTQTKGESIDQLFVITEPSEVILSF
ncbi:hypothetical protein L6452_22386 [Arctium lappa]|uniref:Uncharacterized protein n=1 Tax=Arctium lappa TaxID=4217 RepID=A0ACB9B0J5_ARCLA|nr:hypothetical protein L6452_22386 [Arctium lappa]